MKESEALAVWITLGVTVVGAIISVSVIWGGMREAVKNLRTRITNGQRLSHERHEEALQKIADLRKQYEEDEKDRGRHEEYQDRRLRNLELKAQTLHARVHRLEDDSQVTPPPNNTGGEDG